MAARLAAVHLRGAWTRTGWLRPPRTRTAGHRPPAVILLHGLGSNPGIWRPMARALRQRGAGDLGVLRYAASTQPTEAILAELDHLVVDAQRRGHAKVVLIGHSLGGILGALYAQRHPGRVAQLVLLASPVRPTDADGRLEPQLDSFVTKVARRGRLLERIGRGHLVATSRAMADRSVTGSIRPLIDGELGVDVVSVVGRDDRVASPTTTRVSGPRARNLVVDGTHASIVFDPSLAALVATGPP